VGENNRLQIQKKLFPTGEAQIKERDTGAQSIQSRRSTPGNMREHEIGK